MSRKLHSGHVLGSRKSKNPKCLPECNDRNQSKEGWTIQWRRSNRWRSGSLPSLHFLNSGKIGFIFLLSCRLIRHTWCHPCPRHSTDDDIVPIVSDNSHSTDASSSENTSCNSIVSSCGKLNYSRYFYSARYQSKRTAHRPLVRKAKYRHWTSCERTWGIEWPWYSISYFKGSVC